MKIESSKVGLDGQSRLESRRTLSVAGQAGPVSGFMAALAGAAGERPGASGQRAPATGESFFSQAVRAGQQRQAQQQALRQAMEALFERLFAALMARLRGEGAPAGCADGAPPAPAAAASGAEAGPVQDVLPVRSVALPALRFDYTHQESQSSALSVRAEVCTRDGRRLEVALCFEQASSFTESWSASFPAGEYVLRDPLVLHFDAPASSLSGERFAFDLDADGQQEWLPGLGRGAAYLVFDADGDGHIADGREVVGALSGDGFADLRAADDDGNGWIDEGDALFARLGLWQPGKEGGAPVSLAEAGIGALYTGNAATPFRLRDGERTLLAQTRSSGLYLHEDGRAGLMQQIDVAFEAGEEGALRNARL